MTSRTDAYEAIRRDALGASSVSGCSRFARPLRFVRKWNARSTRTSDGRGSAMKYRSAIRAQRLPARLSPSAGRYLCNFAYWRALALTDDTAALVQFVHVPPVRRVAMRPAGTQRGART